MRRSWRVQRPLGTSVGLGFALPVRPLVQVKVSVRRRAGPPRGGWAGRLPLGLLVPWSGPRPVVVPHAGLARNQLPGYVA